MADLGAQGSSLQSEAAYLRLLDEIRSGRLPSGARLIESDVAERLAISRTPVREAIRQLEADGLVTHPPRIGAMVRRLEYAEVMELYEMRSVLEGTAARMASRSAGEVELAELAAINEGMTVTSDPLQLAALDQRFHLTLIDAARNRHLVRAVQSVRKIMLLLGPTTLEEEGRAQAAMAEHAAVLSALSARDGTAAEAAMRRHMDAAHQLRLRQICACESFKGWNSETLRARPADDA